MEGFLKEIKPLFAQLEENLQKALDKTEDRFESWIGCDWAAEKYEHKFKFQEIVKAKIEKREQEHNAELAKRKEEFENELKRKRDELENDTALRKSVMESLEKNPRLIKEAREKAEDRFYQALVASNFVCPPPSYEVALKIVNDNNNKKK